MVELHSRSGRVDRTNRGGRASRDDRGERVGKSRQGWGQLAELLGVEESVELIKLVGLEELEEKETDLLLLTELEPTKLE